MEDIKASPSPIQRIIVPILDSKPFPKLEAFDPNISETGGDPMVSMESVQGPALAAAVQVEVSDDTVPLRASVHPDSGNESPKEFKLYICQSCPKRFLQLHQLQAHLRIHTKEKPYSCDFCPMKFSQIGPKGRHEGIVHADKLQSKSLLQCSWCLKVCPTASALQAHLRIHTGEKPFKCGYCAQEFSMAWNRNSHEKRAHGKVCEPGSRSSTDLACATCNVKFYTLQAANNHKLQHASKSPFNCHFCPKKYTRVQAKRAHEATAHASELKEASMLPLVKVYTCALCSKLFKTPLLHKRHQSVHTGEKLFKCVYCNKKFASLAGHRVHMLFHTDPHAGERRYECKFCSQKFAHISAKYRHQQITCDHKKRAGVSADSEVKSRLRCSICYRTCRSKAYLAFHVKCHSGEDRPYPCRYCPLEFKTLGPLLQHESKLHPDQGYAHVRRLHQCTKCFKLFVSKTELALHTTLHDDKDATLFECLVCCRVFETQSFLQSHFRTMGHASKLRVVSARQDNMPPSEGSELSGSG